MNRKVSIIIPVYNCEKYISRCLDSIINQTYDNLEVIVINDGSTDNTLGMLKNYSKKYPYIKVYTQKNSGVSSARNNGIKKATGYYIQFTDADDYLSSDMIELMVKSSVENESDLVVCEYKYVYESDNSEKEIHLSDYNNVSFKSVISNESSKYGGFPWNKLIKKECIEKYYDESIYYYENLLFFLENANRIKKYSVVHIPLYNYFINSQSALHSRVYNIRRITSLLALNRIIDIVDIKYKDFYKYNYISQYKWNIKNIRNNNLMYDYSKYTSYYNRYKKELLRKNNLSIIYKAKLIIRLILK
jgi:glycosyltransferase involved in cell wall biosynthesis